MFDQYFEILSVAHTANFAQQNIYYGQLCR